MELYLSNLLHRRKKKGKGQGNFQLEPIHIPPHPDGHKTFASLGPGNWNMSTIYKIDWQLCLISN